MKNWKDLDADVRRALLRGEPAADPEIDRIAREHAEKALGRSIIRRVIVVFPIALVTGALLGFFAAKCGLPSWAPGSILFAVGSAIAVVESRRKLAHIRILNVSSGTPRAQTRTEWTAARAAESLEIRSTASGVLRTTAPWLALAGGVLVLAVLSSIPWLIVPVAVFAVTVVTYVALLLWFTLPGNEQILDADGIFMPKYGLRVPWKAIREIRLLPLRATARDKRQVVAFLFHDKQDYLRQLPRWQAVLADLNTKTYLSPLVIIEGVTDRPVEEIAARAGALSGLVVTAVACGD
ncbi:hypothetical protein ABZ319_37930 [Nocardia sp. NPDC005978]|uniref:hypothetical protein n=1 Tax=Nocardia sp. NPDC005978 TaxID=3156725 RepID=UPI00339ECF66